MGDLKSGRYWIPNSKQITDKNIGKIYKAIGEAIFNEYQLELFPPVRNISLDPEKKPEEYLKGNIEKALRNYFELQKRNRYSCTFSGKGILIILDNRKIYSEDILKLNDSGEPFTGIHVSEGFISLNPSKASAQIFTGIYKLLQKELTQQE